MGPVASRVVGELVVDIEPEPGVERAVAEEVRIEQIEEPMASDYLAVGLELEQHVAHDVGGAARRARIGLAARIVVEAPHLAREHEQVSGRRSADVVMEGVGVDRDAGRRHVLLGNAGGVPAPDDRPQHVHLEHLALVAVEGEQVAVGKRPGFVEELGALVVPDHVAFGVVGDQSAPLGVRLRRPTSG